MKKLLTVAVALCFAAFAAQAVTHDISTGNLEIISGGDYTVTGTTTEYSVSVDTTEAVSLTLNNVSITGVPCAINITGGSVEIVLFGNNFLVSNDSAGIHVAQDASLTISGSGKLMVDATSDGNAGIGGESRENSGAITINSGTITATGATFAAGIGGGEHAVANVTINGGTVTAIAGHAAAGIGGGTGWEGGAGTITINGGFVKATAGNGAGIGCGDEGGRLNPGIIRITGGTIEAMSVNGAGIGAGSGAGESGSYSHIYISGGSIKASSDNGSPIGPGAGHGTGPAPSTGPGGDPVYLATVAKAFGNLKDSFTFTTTKDALPYTYEYTGPGHDSDSNLYFYLPNGEYTASGTNGRKFSGTIENGPGTLTRVIPSSVNLHMEDGNITIETDIGATQGGTIIGLYAQYVIDGSTDDGSVYVSSEDSPNIVLSGVSITGICALDINAGTVNLVLEGNNVLNSDSGAGLRVAPGTYLNISGTGSLSATSRYGASAGIGGESWENSGVITINSGTITATGSQYAAGIGGGEHAKANVTINGGSVTAIAGHAAAGIGGGTGWEGGAGTININGGFVKATAGNGAGIGCGDEGGHNFPGEITITGGTIEAHSENGAGIGAGSASGESGRVPAIYITGGSVKASSDHGSPIGPGVGEGEGPSPKTAGDGEFIYLATLSDATAPAPNSIYAAGDGEVTFTATRKSDSRSYGYEGEGHSDSYDLFFYLPEGEYTVTGSNGKSYAGSVSSSGSTIVPVPEPAILGLLALVALCFHRK